MRLFGAEPESSTTRWLWIPGSLVSLAPRMTYPSLQFSKQQQDQ
jgi:hypothetical protein